MEYVITELDKAYAAGFFDGEGSVTIARPLKKWRRTFILYLSVAQDLLEPLIWLQSLWGGSISKGDVRLSGKSNRRWTTSGPTASRFLLDIIPYLRVKKKQAQLGIELQNLKVGYSTLGVPEDILIKEERIREQVLELNGRYKANGRYGKAVVRGKSVL